jgi:hypothetical protein
MQRLKQAGVRIEEFTFSASPVGRLAMTLLQLIRERELALPDDDELISELRGVRLKESSPGVFRLDHDRGQHDDRAVALSLAATALVERPPQTPGRTVSPFARRGRQPVARSPAARPPVARTGGIVRDPASVGSASRLIARALREQGVDRVHLAVIGLGVPHFHLHLYPRYPGVPIETPWMQVDALPDAPHGGAEEIAAFVERLREQSR